MARKKKPLPIFREITITDIAAEGKSVVKVTIPEHDGTPESRLVIFVPYCVPGDVVDLQVTRKKHSYAEAKVIKFHKYSEIRTTPPCQHFGVCGGCKWQHLPYDLQLKYKEQQVVDALQRIAKVELPEISPILGSEKIYEYRNKLEFTFSNKRWLTDDEIRSDVDFDKADALGFHIPGLFDKVLDIKDCHLQPEPSNAIREAIKRFCRRKGFSFFDLRQQTGFMRTLVIRNNQAGDFMVIVVFFLDEKERREELLDYIAKEFPCVKSLMYIVNNKRNDSLTDMVPICYKGEDHLVEEMDGLKFRVGAKSFYQTNSKQALTLYKVARDFAQLTGDEVVYDLYTGTGTIANFVARQAKKVVGIEYVEEAVADARINSKLNNIDNTVFFAGDMKDILTDGFIQTNGKPDVIIVDPPRAGMHDDVIKVILNASPKRIVYVSCNPATQARDISLLAEKYDVTKVQPVDMFPHTQHVESVVLLSRK